MHRLIPSLCLLVLSAFWAGCSTVSSPHLIGQPYGHDEGSEISDVGDHWNGVWLGLGPGVDGTDVFHLYHEGQGRLQITSLGDSELDKEFIIAVITTHEETFYLNLSDPEEPDNGYLFFKFLPLGPDQFILFPPRVNYFADAVRQRQYPGEVEGSHGTQVRLGGTKKQIDTLIRRANVDDQFMLDEAILIRRFAP